MERVPPQSFDRQKTAYFADFAKAHLSAFRPHYQRGETLGKSPEVWRNVSEHCLVAGAYADILADVLGVEPETKETIVKAAIIHDWYKKHDSAQQREASRSGTLSLKTLSDIKSRETGELRQMGISEDVIELASANAPKTSEGPHTIAEKIIWYVDCMLSNTQAVPINERFDNLERGWDGLKEDPVRAERNIAFSNLYKEQYGGKSLFEVQRSLGDKISSEFATMMNYDGDPHQLPNFLTEKLRERITQRGA